MLESQPLACSSLLPFYLQFHCVAVSGLPWLQIQALPCAQPPRPGSGLEWTDWKRGLGNIWEQSLGHQGSDLGMGSFRLGEESPWLHKFLATSEVRPLKVEDEDPTASLDGLSLQVSGKVTLVNRRNFSSFSIDYFSGVCSPKQSAGTLCLRHENLIFSDCSSIFSSKFITIGTA